MNSNSCHGGFTLFPPFTAPPGRPTRCKSELLTLSLGAGDSLWLLRGQMPASHMLSSRQFPCAAPFKNRGKAFSDSLLPMT